MKGISRILRRALALALCGLLAVPGMAEGLRFSVRASVDPLQYPSQYQQLLSGLSSLLDAAALEGAIALAGDSFELDAALLLGEGRSQSRTELNVHGMSSHWGIRSPLLGNEELMVNLSSLLPFGQKAADWLGLPLDKAALLVPYTHVDALDAVWEIVAPLFPAENGKTYFTRAQLDEMANKALALCDEDAALNRWLEATGTYRLVRWYLRAFLELPALVVPGMTVSRSDAALSWDVYIVNILSIKQEADSAAVIFSIPTLISANASASLSNGLMTGTLHAQVDDRILVDASFSLPASLPATLPGFYLSLDAKAPLLPESGFRLDMEGEAIDNTLIMRLLHPDTGAAMLTLTANVANYTPDALPSYTPADLTGMNLLSVTSDSLRELLTKVRQPLLTGAFDLLVAAPPEAVQSLMDYAEDSGLLDLLTDALSGGTGY